MPEAWWETFFDEDYFDIWGAFLPVDRTEREAEGLWTLLGLAPGARVLDAPCGWGRLSLPLSRRGAFVLAVDQSAALLDHVERERGTLGPDQLRTLRHDLREPLAESGFDAALNVFTSLGYGTEDDDLAIVRTLAAAVRPGGLVLIETMHRDLLAVKAGKGVPGHRAEDGTLVVETPRFDPLTGRVETTWWWCGPRGPGSKSASLRVYSASELVSLVERAGLRVRSAHRGCTPEPFAPYEGRLGLVAERP